MVLISVTLPVFQSFIFASKTCAFANIPAMFVTELVSQDETSPLNAMASENM
jgi:hypothetical protein